MVKEPASSNPWDDGALAQSRHAWDRTFEVLRARYSDLLQRAEQPRHGLRVIFMVGDSIARGVKGKSFDFDPSNPGSAVQHIDRLINLMAGDRPIRALYAGIPGPHLARLLKRVAVDGDFILFQDWGWRPRTYAATYHNFASVAALVSDFEGIRGIFLNTYASTGASPEYRFDLPCADNRLTPNDAIAATARDFGFHLIDVYSRMGRFDAFCGGLGLAAMQNDGVHPNELGNLFLSCLILREVVDEPSDPRAALRLIDEAAGAVGEEILAHLGEAGLA